MSDIPSEIVAEFLSRVPAKSLLRFRCVSKSWRAIIDSPSFIKRHLNQTIQTNSDRKLILGSYHFSPTSCRSGPLRMADFDSLEKTNWADNMEFDDPDHPLKGPDTEVDVWGSCHGILCLVYGANDIVLWNLTTRKHLKLPLSEFEFPGGTMSGTPNLVYGFGYDKLSDDYKVLRIFQSSEVEVFSVKSKSWRKLQSFPYHLRYGRDHAVLAEGALHWVVYPNRESRMETLIVAFDFGTEEFRLVVQPDYPKKGLRMMTVGFLGESLCLFCNYHESKRLDIWVMVKDAGKESWNKLFTVTESDFEAKPFEYAIPVAYSMNGCRVLMLQNSVRPLWYDLKERKISGSMSSISCYPDFLAPNLCFGSLVQLDGGVSDKVRRVADKEKAKGSQDTKKESKKKRDDFLCKGFKLVL